MEEDEEDRHMAHLVGDNSNPQRFWWEIVKETDLLEDLFVVGSVTFIRILNKQDGRARS
jgi:hypothetical protein